MTGWAQTAHASKVLTGLSDVQSQTGRGLDWNEDSRICVTPQLAPGVFYVAIFPTVRKCSLK